MATWMTRYIEAWDSLDPPAITTFHSEDGTCDDVTSGQIYKGREEIAALVRAVKQSSPDGRFSLVSEQQCGEWYAFEWEFSGTDTGGVDGRPPTNKAFRARGISVGELDESGKIKIDREYYQRQELD
jgi:steroid delta-isomerase-like uncharacterized protein